MSKKKPRPWDDPEYRFLKPGWPPGFVPQFDTTDIRLSARLSRASREARDKMLQEGGERAWVAKGTIPGLGGSKK